MRDHHGAGTSSRRVIALALVAVVISTVWYVVPALRLAWPFPGVAFAVSTLVSIAALALAVLFLLQHHRTHLVSDLLLAFGFSFTAMLEVVLPILNEIEPGTATITLWSRATSRTLLVVLLAVSAWMPRAKLRRPVPGVWLLSGGAAMAAGIVLLTWARESSLPSAVVSADPSSDAGILAIGGTSFWIRVTGAVLCLVAAVGFLRQERKTGDALFGWMAIAAVVLATGRVHDALFPTLMNDWISTGDVLRAAGLVVLFAGVMLKVDHVWRDRISEADSNARRRVARELHDGLAQELAFLSTQSMHIANGHADEEQLGRLVASAERALRDTRDAIAELSARGDLRLDKVLEAISREISERHACPVRIDLDEVTADEHTARELARVAQEALANAAQHGEPDEITMRLRASKHALVLSVADDGHGFIGPGPDEASGFGLISMRERVRELGGVCTIHSDAELGTEVRIEVPA